MGPNAICPVCKQEIDEDTCWCGDYIASHTGWEGHMTIAMGCICYRNDFDWQTAYKQYLEELNADTKT